MLAELGLEIKNCAQWSRIRWGRGTPNDKIARAIVAGPKTKLHKLSKQLGASFEEVIQAQKKPVLRLWTETGVTFLVRPALVVQYAGSSYAQAREALGALIAALEEAQLSQVLLEWEGMEDRGIVGGLVGLGLAQYRYLRAGKKEDSRVMFYLDKPVAPELVREAETMAEAINVCRHLVNSPPNVLNPVSYAALVKRIFESQKSVRVEVWNQAKLRREGMGLHLAVGQGAQHPPQLVHIRYRPSGSSGKPVALVGKGITFDSGGLDIKPSAGMRLMKKDMGGSAAVLGAVLWASRQRLKVPIDAYLAIAENAVDEKSFRPSDVVTARNGLRVEIHNTDAEGRLVLADALDVATRKVESQKPRVVVDVATLTGAIKVALGAEIAGLFCNDEALAKQFEKAAFGSGDPVWRMPLYQKYRAQSHSNFADMVNASDGFGGAITAALFLESFVDKVPWAHLDMYAWKDSPEGSLLEVGASGQSVQTLIEFLRGQSS